MTTFPVDKFSTIETPFYYYDVELLRSTLGKALEEAGKYDGFHVHYAIKANFNPQLLEVIKSSGMGADCVSGGEVRAAINAGIAPGKIVFAGVGKTDKEISALCYRYAEEFTARFGSLLCRELRPGGFQPSDPPHACEGLTVDTVLFAMDFMQKHLRP